MICIVNANQILLNILVNLEKGLQSVSSGMWFCMNRDMDHTEERREITSKFRMLG